SRPPAIASSPRSSQDSAWSTSTTSNPAWAATWAMPLPIVPAPITPMVETSLTKLLSHPLPGSIASLLGGCGRHATRERLIGRIVGDVHRLDRSLVQPEPRHIRGRLDHLRQIRLFFLRESREHVRDRRAPAAPDA